MRARGRADLTVQQLWLHYVALGGTCDVFDLDAFLQGLTTLAPVEQDVLAHALNEHLDDLYRAAQVPYLTIGPPPAADNEDPLTVIGAIIAEAIPSPPPARRQP